MMRFASILHRRIELKYAERGDQLGWRLLYSPASVLDGAEVAFIGLNPGGSHDEPDHPSFACPPGISAYVHESWKDRPPGEEVLQRQVRFLFDRMGVEPTGVLAGNLVPFRSPDWGVLKDPDDATRFGRELWTDILATAKPRLIITMGGRATEELAKMLGLEVRRIRAGWGSVRISVGASTQVKLLGLPHLSRFQLFSRKESLTIVGALLDAAGADFLIPPTWRDTRDTTA